MSLRSTKSTITASKLKGISLNTVLLFTVNGIISDAVHNIRSKFAIFDHIMFEIMISVSHFAAAITFTKNSGADVQNDRIVNQITIGGILYLVATLDEPSTKNDHHLTRVTNHAIIQNT